MQNKIVITIIFDHKLWSCKRAYRYASLEATQIWEYPKIGPWFVIEEWTSIWVYHIYQGWLYIYIYFIPFYRDI